MTSPPSRVHLPSGRALRVEARPGLPARRRRSAAPLFSELVDLVGGGDVTLYEGATAVDVTSLELRDFHTLRAIATRLRWLHEEPIDLRCDNCGALLSHAPCSALELGPFVDGELDDPELDPTLDLGRPWPLAAVALGDGRVASEVTLVARTAAAAAPLHRALRRRRWAVSDRLVVAMGVAALGDERDPRRIAGALARASDASWAELGGWFLAAHYPLRLASTVICSKCGARNEVDAPYEREFEPPPDDLSADRGAHDSTAGSPSNAEVFPAFELFAAQAQADWERSPVAQGGVTLIVEQGVPACDDGGVPLLGSYVPPGGEPWAPIGVAEITVYYRTFEASWNEEGPYDWREELRETIEHEGEHHAAWQRGSDETDDEERAEIVRERVRWVGRRRAMRSSVAALGADVRGFIAHTWPIWVIVAAATLAISVCGK